MNEDAIACESLVIVGRAESPRFHVEIESEPRIGSKSPGSSAPRPPNLARLVRRSTGGAGELLRSPPGSRGEGVPLARRSPEAVTDEGVHNDGLLE